MSDVSMSPEPTPSLRSWSDVFHALRSQAEAQRGAITAPFPDAQDAFTFPRTTGQDVLAISVVFDGALRAHASSSILQRWLAENDLIASQSPWTLADPYVGNRSYWSTLAIVAIELDRVHAPLPDADLWNGAMEQLSAASGPLRNAAGAMLITLFTAPTWAEMAERQVQLFRVLRGEDRIDHPRLPSVPRTCNADVLELARYWTEQLARIGSDPSDTHARLAYAHWPDVVGNVVRFAKRGNPRAPYIHNAEFWIALALLAQGDACQQLPAPWAFQVPSTEHIAARNAAPVDDSLKVEFPEAKTWDDAARMQRDYMSQLRGEDVIPGGGLVTRIPRTTISDVRQLAAYWSNALRKVGDHNVADISYRHVVDRWKAAIADVDRIPVNAAATAVYERNRDFWTALMTIAIQVAVTDEAPGRWTLIKESAAHGVKSLPDTLSTVWGTVVDAGKRAVSDALARPLLYAGGAIAGGLLLYLLFRNNNPATVAVSRP
jgi:hypothetical protein